MIYFDNAATSFPKAPGVGDAMADFLANHAANPGRAGHRMAVAAERMLDDTRLQLAKLFDAPDHNRVVFALNCTDALNMAIKGVLGAPVTDTATRDHVITTNLEHNSVSRPLQALADAQYVDLTRVDCDTEGIVDPAAIEAAITPATRMIVMTHASNVLGTVQDAAAVGAIARKHNVLFCLDAAQTAGALPVSIEKMHIDLLAFPGHKSLLGPTGTGGLYVGDRCPQPAQPDNPNTNVPTLRPWREGGTGGDSSTPTQPPLYPYFLEGGTPNTVGIAGLARALDYLADADPASAINHERAMIQLILDHLADNRRVTIYGPTGPDAATHRVGALSINIDGLEPSDAASILDDSFDIATRPGLHCAPYTHRRLNTYPSGTLRISPGPFTTNDDIDALLNALDQLTA